MTREPQEPWWNYCHRSKPPIPVWPQRFWNKLFLKIDQIDFRFFWGISASWSQAREHNLPNLPDLKVAEVELNQFVSNYVCRKNSMEPLSFAIWKAPMLQIAWNIKIFMHTWNFFKYLKVPRSILKYPKVSKSTFKYTWCLYGKIAILSTSFILNSILGVLRSWDGWVGFAV